MDDTPEQRYDRLRDAVQETILHNFPNPERKGCPGERVVREVSGRRELIEDDAWEHITHCSPCYAAFLQDKDAFRLARRRRGLVLIIAAAFFVVVGSSITIFELNREREGSRVPRIERYQTATLDLRDTSSTRGTEPTAHSAAPLWLPRNPLDLTIYLPFGSSAGKYEVRLRRGTQALLTVQGTARVAQGITELHVKADLSRYKPGQYLIGVRHAPWNWTDYVITVQ